MLNTLGSSEIKSVPQEWIFKHYLNIEEELEGQEIKVKSVFTEEKTASLFIYCNESGKYRFKDFSSGKSGDGVDLVRELFTNGKVMTNMGAIKKILKDFEEYGKTNGVYIPRIIIPQSNYRLKDFQIRKWTESDRNYWQQFKISSKSLEHFKIFPLEKYWLWKEENGYEKVLEFSNKYMYGYFRLNGELTKIYQPKCKEHKFIRFKSYIEGTDQLAGKEILLINKSRKDIACVHEMDLGIDQVAPDSENTLIPKTVIDFYKGTYKKIMCIFDFDCAGQKAMLQYKEKYDLPGLSLQMAKDCTDSVKDFGFKKVKNKLKQLIYE